MRLEQITNEILHVNFSTQMEITSTFLRFQEYYESPKFRGKIFSLEEYKQWYTAEKGAFTYYEDWNGFNIPSHVLQPFYEGKFVPLSDKEKGFLELFKERTGIFYIIGTHGDAESETLRHEIAHGLYYTVPEYRQEVDAVLAKVDTEAIRKHLLETSGYSEEVLQDEVHAYLLSDYEAMHRSGVAGWKHWPVSWKLGRIYNKHFRKDA